jgi:hypothetical protein
MFSHDSNNRLGGHHRETDQRGPKRVLMRVLFSLALLVPMLALQLVAAAPASSATVAGFEIDGNLAVD